MQGVRGRHRRRAAASVWSTALLIALLDLPALVVTLGTLYVVAGIQAKIVGGTRITPDHLPDDFISFGVDRFLGIPKLMWIVLVVGAIASVYLRHVPLGPRPLRGRQQPAGRASSPESRCDAHAHGGYLVCGACAGAAGVLFVARLGGVDANAGGGYELAGDRRLRRRRRQHLRRLRHGRRRPARGDAAALDRLLAERPVDSRSSGSRPSTARCCCSPSAPTASSRFAANRPNGSVNDEARRAAFKWDKFVPVLAVLDAGRRQLLERQVPDDRAT